jgi:hypothetical protein
MKDPLVFFAGAFRAVHYGDKGGRHRTQPHMRADRLAAGLD